jgi:basic membrane lipoprotein Med (substrate-binding protein (PBP1-ABC) superfamily)
MKILKVYLSNKIKEYEGDTLYTTNNSIILLKNKNIIYQANEINDWSKFEIIGEIDKTEQQVMQEALDDVILTILNS